MGNVTPERRVAALLRSRARAEREAFPPVAPCDFVVALYQLFDAVSPQYFTLFHLLCVILRPPGVLPESVHGLLGMQSNRVGHGR